MRRRKHYRNKKRLFTVFSFFLLMMIGFLARVSIVDASAEDSDRYKYYTSVYVDRDVSLWTVSQKYMTEEYADIHVYMDEVKAINHMTDDELEYGTTICVPYYSDEFKQ